MLHKRKENNHENTRTTRLRTRRATETAVPYRTTTKNLGRTLRDYPLVLGAAPHTADPLILHALPSLSLYRSHSPTTPHTLICRLRGNRPEYLSCRVPQSTAVRTNLTHQCAPSPQGGGAEQPTADLPTADLPTADRPPIDHSTATP